MPKTILVAATALVLALAGLAFLAPEVDARPRRALARSGPPSEQTLSCIRQWETGGGVPGRADYGEAAPGWDPVRRNYRGFATAYQFDPAFARDYSAAIPDEHWRLWGSDRAAPPWTWHPMIQDEVARNGYRARQLGPWPTPSRRCRGL